MRIYTPEEVTAARAWAANKRRTGAGAREALREMGWPPCPEDMGAAYDIACADSFVRIVLYDDECARLEAEQTEIVGAPGGLLSEVET
jgi:hypothetical protein